MRKVYITFSGDKYHETTKKIVEEAPKMGATDVWVYDDWWLTHHRPDFVRINQRNWKHHDGLRGFGWFCWKPLVIIDALRRVSDGDVVLYTDADTYPIADLGVIFDIASRDGVMLFAAQGQPHRWWCKRDCFIIMDMDEPKYNSASVQAGVARFMAFKKGPWANDQFLMEWLTYCVNLSCTTFDKSHIAPEYPELHEHRTEQAIFTNLAHKYGHKLWREACEFGNGDSADKEVYGQLFVQIGSHSFGQQRGQGSDFRNIND